MTMFVKIIKNGKPVGLIQDFKVTDEKYVINRGEPADNNKMIEVREEGTEPILIVIDRKLQKLFDEPGKLGRAFQELGLAVPPEDHS